MSRLITLTCIASCLAAGGCSILRPEPGGVLTATSTDGARSLSPTYTTVAYTSFDADTADVYLSDIPRERFTNPRDNLSDCAGSILHLHIFIVPEAGQTPIDATACNLTARQLVLTSRAPQGMGLYGGGGFLLPYGEFGVGSISGSIHDASQRLTRSSVGFKDLLGPGTLAGSFAAPLDDALAQQMSVKFETLVARLPAVSSEDVDLKPAPKKPTEKTGKPGEKAPEKPATK